MTRISGNVLAGAAMVLAACFMGCSSEPATAPDGTDGAEGRVARWTIGMSQANLGEPWRVQMNADIRRAAEAHSDITLVFRDAQNDTLRQRAHIEEFLNQGVDLLLVSPKEPALRDTIGRVYEAGIPVIILDRDVGGDAFTQFIGADNILIGKAAGAYIVDFLVGEGRVVELKGLMTTVPGQDRHRGFREAIAGSAIEIVFEADMQWLEPNARNEMESALARFSEINLVYAHNDPGAHGAWLAARAAGRQDDIAFVGIDALPQEGQAYVREGILDATFLYPTGGQEAVENALAILGGASLPKRVVLDSRLYTKENIAEGGIFLDLSGTAEDEAVSVPSGVVSVQQGTVQSNIDAAIGGQAPTDEEATEDPEDHSSATPGESGPQQVSVAAHAPDAAPGPVHEFGAAHERQ